MPSIILGNNSGGQNILSGAILWPSGVGTPKPVGGVQIRLDRGALGNAYFGFSGNLTINSGPCLAGAASGHYGSGLLDGTPLYPGDVAFVPRLGVIGTSQSGMPALFVATDATASGQARLYFEPY